MFGLTLEKMLIIAILAAIIVGPRRLPHYAQRLAELVRTVRVALESARTRAEDETGISLRPESWQSLDPRQYDPRRIVRNALQPDSATGAAMTSDAAAAIVADSISPVVADVAATPATDPAAPAMRTARVGDTEPTTPIGSPVETVAPLGRSNRVSGSSGHPRRLFAVPAPEAAGAEPPAAPAASGVDGESVGPAPVAVEESAHPAPTLAVGA